jgi:hypothetical protein
MVVRMTPSPTLPLARSDDDLVVRLLKEHIPLTLLMDLAQRDPRSAELYANERDTDS